MPHNIKNIQIFISFANFYWCFMNNFSAIYKPITDLLKGDPHNFNWKQEQIVAFAYLKQLFTTAPILCHFILNKLMVVETDTSDYALSCVLSQIIDKKLHPVTFHSRKFNAAEINYEIHDKELLTIIKAFKK